MPGSIPGTGGGIVYDWCYRLGLVKCPGRGGGDLGVTAGRAGQFLAELRSGKSRCPWVPLLASIETQLALCDCGGIMALWVPSDSS